MGWYNNLGLRWKLLSGFTLVLALMTVAGMFSLIKLNEQDSTTQSIATREIPTVLASLDTQISALTMQRDLRQGILVNDEQGERTWQASYRTAEQRFNDGLMKLQQMVDTPEGKQHLAGVTDAAFEWGKTRGQIFELVR